MQKLLAAFAVIPLALSFARAAETGFTFKDTPGQYLDVLYNGKIVARYMDGHDLSTPDKHTETFKPYLHVFDAQGTAPITKGPGGLFPHHRGLFIGYDAVTVGGQSYDRWHMKGGDQIHEKFTAQKAGADSATFTSQVRWTQDGDKGAVLEEERTFTFLPPPAPGYLLVDMSSKLKAVAGETQLAGTVEHAGIHLRPSDDITRDATVYVFPKKNANAHKDKDYPWMGESFTLNGKRYSVVYFNAPTNPKQSAISAYRDYGRFGIFFKTTIPEGKDVTLRCRILVAEGEMPPAEVIEKIYNAFAGTSDPVPELTVKKGESMAANPAQKPAAKEATPAATP